VDRGERVDGISGEGSGIGYREILVVKNVKDSLLVINFRAGNELHGDFNNTKN